ncbi:hypothetical protein APA_2871 [Pseudanabaena sp. lw0831]|nr:hypothetical protein APA_2871 [Pseudanabaena sp. lw0831]
MYFYHCTNVCAVRQRNLYDNIKKRKGGAKRRLFSFWVQHYGS